MQLPASIQLTERDRVILTAVVRQFILTGSPVSSRAVAKQEPGGLSAATIRNTMADLEDAGLLSQPHTSAGRVPTSEGYHFYIDSLMPNDELSDRERDSIEEVLADATGADELVQGASHVLSELSGQISIVLTPGLGETVVRSLNFVPLSAGRVLCVLESATGFVDHKIVEPERELSAEELTRISNYLTEQFGGVTLEGMRDQLLHRMAEERAQVGRLLSDAIQMARLAVSEREPDLLVEGTASVLSQPELGDVDRVRRLVDMFEDKASVVSLLNQLLGGRGVRVVIGEESHLTSDLDFSLVAKPYGASGRHLGSLSVFGPSRMEYQKVIPLVDYLGARLSQALESTFSE